MNASAFHMKHYKEIVKCIALNKKKNHNEYVLKIEVVYCSGFTLLIS